MSKLPSEHKFLDLSDYGRLPARWIANALKKTRLTAIHLNVYNRWHLCNFHDANQTTLCCSYFSNY